MFNTVVWATDGSEDAIRALPYAKALASERSSYVQRTLALGGSVKSDPDRMNVTGLLRVAGGPDRDRCRSAVQRGSRVIAHQNATKQAPPRGSDDNQVRVLSLSDFAQPPSCRVRKDAKQLDVQPSLLQTSLTASGLKSRQRTRPLKLLKRMRVVVGRKSRCAADSNVRSAHDNVNEIQPPARNDQMPRESDRVETAHSDPLRRRSLQTRRPF